MIRNVILAFVFWTLVSSTVFAELHQEKPQQEKVAAVGPHGGQLVIADANQIETVIVSGGVRVFVYDANGQPLDVHNSRGLMTLRINGVAKRYRYDLYPELGQDKSAKSLAVAVDLSRIAGSQVDLEFQLVGISGADQRPVKFSTNAVVPLSNAQQVAAAIELQKVCPVSGQLLTSMGKPIAVEMGKQTVFVCCTACIDTLKSNPQKYLAVKPAIKVTPTTEADAEAIAAQKLCPVMDEPLGSMGKPLKVTGLGRDVYLCCKGCLKFLEKDPHKYLAKLPQLTGAAKPVVEKVTRADTPFAAAQKLCPVMDEPLEGMGGPYKTVVSGRIIYICCPGCAKKVHSNPEIYLTKLAKRGVTPPAVQ